LKGGSSTGDSGHDHARGLAPEEVETPAQTDYVGEYGLMTTSYGGSHVPAHPRARGPRSGSGMNALAFVGLKASLAAPTRMARVARPARAPCELVEHDYMDTGLKR
jgi:hypothetical protein